MMAKSPGPPATHADFARSLSRLRNKRRLVPEVSEVCLGARGRRAKQVVIEVSRRLL
jgi:hypothetical protein